MKQKSLDKMLKNTEQMFSMAGKVSRDESATAVNQIIDNLQIELDCEPEMQS
jgi:hypothetical protein